MKKLTFDTASNARERVYLDALQQFFKGIPEIIYVSDIYIVKTTKDRVYLHVGNIIHDRNCHIYVADMFIRKKNLSVEFCYPGTGEIATQQYLNLFKENPPENNGWD